MQGEVPKGNRDRLQKDHVMTTAFDCVQVLLKHNQITLSGRPTGVTIPYSPEILLYTFTFAHYMGSRAHVYGTRLVVGMAYHSTFQVAEIRYKVRVLESGKFVNMYLIKGVLHLL